MAECNISRCSHERRIFRRELHKWSKEILYILGLERLAEELMGAWKWKILVQPFSDLESKSPVDWYPEETCYFCCAKKQPPYDPASGIIPTIDSYNSIRLDTDEHSTSSDQVKLSGSFISCSSAVSAWGVNALSSISNSPPLDQPLDLSIGTLKQPLLEGIACSMNEIHSNHINSTANDSSCLKSVLKVPQIPLKHGLRKRVDANSKRSYTEEELQAALRDIQSGKLGTRRAAVIYGIPRSTLRNKVYKLANESKSRAHCRVNQPIGSTPKKDQTKDNKLSVDIDVPVYDSMHKQNLSSASNSLRQLLKHTITQKVQSAGKSSDKMKNAFPLLSNIDTMTELQMLGNLEYSQSLGPVLSHVFSDIQNLALIKSKEKFHSVNQSLNALKDEMKLPLLPDLIRRLAEERIELEKDSHKNSDDIEQDESADMPTSCTQSNVILKVPSFKPAKSSSVNFDVENPCLPALSSSSPPPQTSSHSLSGNKGIAVSLKELIARSISQKVNCHLKEEDQSLEYPFCASNADSQGISSSWATDNTQREEKESSLNNTNNSSNSSDSLKSEKRTRPKRGRYRNYDRDNLARAVRAVQKGEMSVHRAGTFYGVPHSTLEYKVKERHLLRPKKRDAYSNSLLSDTSETKTNATFSVENNISLKNLKNNLRQSLETSANAKLVDVSFDASTNAELSRRPAVDSYPSPLSIWQSLPFLSLDFAQLGSDNFFASQMMRKLQENARIHEETQMKQRKQDIGILETLIKSTLEKSVTPDNNSTFILSTDSAANLSDCKEAENIDDK